MNSLLLLAYLLFALSGVLDAIAARRESFPKFRMVPLKLAVRVRQVHHRRRRENRQLPPRKVHRRSHGQPPGTRLEFNFIDPTTTVHNADMETGMGDEPWDRQTTATQSTAGSRSGAKQTHSQKPMSRGRPLAASGSKRCWNSGYLCGRHGAG
ncbi:hypothetical protein MMC07_001655 [Pseudocyphellaria aurata]|nr:hypothetical protein [Pseudocyphellaria aurata]